MARRNDVGPEKTMSIMGHLQELRNRLFVAAFVLITGASLAYVFRDQIIHALLSPLDGRELVYLNPTGGFSFILMISLYAGFAVATPVIVQQLYGFIRPTLPAKIQRYSPIIFFISLFLLLCGVAFGYVFAIPGALSFLYDFAGEYVRASLTADSYLRFVVAYTLGLGVVFQLPLLLMLLHWVKPLTPGGLMRSERWVIVLAFVAAAIITPTPDPLNQTIIALPIIIIYQFGVAAVLINIYRDRRRQKRRLLERKQLSKPQPVAQPEVIRQVATPSAPKVMAAPSAPVAVSALTSRPARRSLDGFVSAPRPAQRAVRQPVRQRSAERTPPRQVQFDRRLYIDGVSRRMNAYW